MSTKEGLSVGISVGRMVPSIVGLSVGLSTVTGLNVGSALNICEGLWVG